MNISTWILVSIVAAGSLLIGVIIGMKIADNWWHKHFQERRHNISKKWG